VRLAVVLSLLTACSFEHGRVNGTPDDGGVDASDGPIDGLVDAIVDGPTDVPVSPLRQKTITIGNVTGSHTDFPLWVSLTDADIGARALADGSDIHFVAGTTDLDFEIQTWTKATGRLDAWVQVPTLATGTQIAIRYGDAAAAHAEDAPGTFTGYAAVWHLDDALTATTIADARNMRNGTASMLNANDSVAAKLGRGVDFTGGNEQITFTNPLSGNTPHTISAWINQRATTDNDAIVVLGNGVLNEARWFHSRYNAATIAVGFYTNDYADANEDVIGDGWVLLHWVYEAGGNRRSRLYRNGTEVGNNSHGVGINTQGTGGFMGNAPILFGTDMGLNATLDEVRIRADARSANWIAAEAANQTNPSTFYTVSAEQVP
jgi:hypothetical protein